MFDSSLTGSWLLTLGCGRKCYYELVENKGSITGYGKNEHLQEWQSFVRGTLFDNGRLIEWKEYRYTDPNGPVCGSFSAHIDPNEGKMKYGHGIDVCGNPVFFTAERK